MKNIQEIKEKNIQEIKELLLSEEGYKGYKVNGIEVSEPTENKASLLIITIKYNHIDSSKSLISIDEMCISDLNPFLNLEYYKNHCFEMGIRGLLKILK